MDIHLKHTSIDIFGENDTMKPEYLKMNPAHSVPTLDDNGFYLWESRAIMCYLVQKYGKDDKLYPKDLQERAQVDKMLFFDASRLYPAIRGYFVNYIRLNREPSDEDFARLKDAMVIFDKILESTPYASGQHVTIADLTLIVTVTTLEALNIDYAQYANVSRWVRKIKELKPYSEAVQAGLNDFKQFVDTKKEEIRKNKL